MLDKDNSSQAIQYKKKFYHFKCFNELCDKRIANKNKTISNSWQDAKTSIDALVIETTKELQCMFAKDEIIQWMIQKYDVSFIGSRIYVKLNEIYNGTFRGLAYKISPVELLGEWRYYWNELCSIRQYKNITGEQAINYDLTVLLNKNAEYRKVKEKEKIARAVREQQQRANVAILPQAKTKWQSKAKIADLYQEMNGGEHDE
jgi:hypothetical protein